MAGRKLGEHRQDGVARWGRRQHRLLKMEKKPWHGTFQIPGQGGSVVHGVQVVQGNNARRSLLKRYPAAIPPKLGGRKPSAARRQPSYAAGQCSEITF